MKKNVFTKKLVINKKTIASLNDAEMNSLLGGNKTEIGVTCYTDAVCCVNTNSLISIVC
jgi:natural product precursor